MDFPYFHFENYREPLATIQQEVKLRLKSDIKTSEPRDLWNVRKVIRPRIKIFVNGNLP